MDWDMDQVIGDREAERTIIDKIERDHGIAVLRGEPANTITFSTQADGGLSALELVLRVAAVRRNPTVLGARRFPCMADIERVETGLIRAVAARDVHRREDLMTGALAYQDQMRLPLCLVEDPGGTDDTVPGADFFERFGFQYIYDRPRYALNTETISAEMLRRAAGGETVSLDLPDTTLQAVAPGELLSLAHFVNARLCRRYGFFTVRSAAQCELEQAKLLGSGGNLFQIMENGVRKGCFACTDTGADSVREVVFDQTFDRKCYIVTEKEAEGKGPAFMARIVNLPEMLGHVTGNGQITIAIRIHDPVIAENDGLFIWYIDEKGSRMERVDEPGTGGADDASMRPEVTVTIGELTAFLFGHIRLKQNAKFDSIYLAGPAWLDDIY